jgi:hypothetical protein
LTRATSLLNAYVDFLSDSRPEGGGPASDSPGECPERGERRGLGQLATQVALKEKDQAKQNAFFMMAQTAFEQARKLDPASQLAAGKSGEYYRARGQMTKASNCWPSQKDSRLLWRYYFRVGKYNEAKG